MTGHLHHYYERQAGAYDALRLDGPEEIELTASVFRTYLQAPARVLDLGCGTGRYGAALQAAGYETTGLDVSEDQLAHAAGLARLVHASAEQMPFEDAAFDGVVAVLMFHQLDAATRARALAECARVVRHDGVLVIKTCTANDLRARWIENHFPSALPFNISRYPSIKRLQNELVSAGFTVVSLVRTETFPAIAVKHLLSAVRERHNTTLASLPA